MDSQSKISFALNFGNPQFPPKVDVPLNLTLRVQVETVSTNLRALVKLCETGQAFVQDTFKFWECIDCDAGRIVEPQSMQSCIDCPSGFYSKQRSTSCSVCLAGTAASSRSGSCIECIAGKYTNESRMSDCINCPTNSYVDRNGATNCSRCPEGGITLIPGSPTISSCICLKGIYGQPYLGKPCLKCPVQEGVSCEDDSPLPYVESGHWRVPGSADHILDCIPASACPLTGISNTTVCAEGYTGYICGKCIPLQYFRLENKCWKCNSAPVLMWFILVLIIFLFLFIAFRITLNASRVPFVSPLALLGNEFWLTFKCRIFESLYLGFKLFRYSQEYQVRGLKKYCFFSVSVLLLILNLNCFRPPAL
jgi:hypothetical protein